MKTKKDILEILNNNPRGLCMEEINRIIVCIKDFDDDTPLTEMVVKIPSYLAYLWGYYIGDKDIMRDRITEPEWIHMWAYNIGDIDIMRERVKDTAWELLEIFKQ